MEGVIRPVSINLLIAYVATWVIHIGYLLFLAAKAKKLREEARELGTIK